MEVARPREEGPETIVNRTSCFQVSDGVPILNFDFSLENFFSTMETISALCGETKEEIFEASEIERFNSMIVFVREWKQFYFCEWMPFYYKSKIVNFSYQTESAEAKNDINGINLPHLSSGAVPKQVEKLHRKSSQFDNDDFVLHVGGSVWALDWCPRLHENIGYDVKCEYLAIAAHPNGSEYHKIGEQLSGRGFIQIWCFLHLDDKEELLKPKGMRRKGEGNKKVNEDSYVPKRKGRPRKTLDDKEELLKPEGMRRKGEGNKKVTEDSCVPKRRGRPRKTLDDKEELLKTEGMRRKGEGNKKVNEDSCVPKRRRRPRKTLDDKEELLKPEGTRRKGEGNKKVNEDSCVPKRRGRPRKTLSRSGSISVGCHKEELQEDINSASDLNGRGKTFLCSGKPIHDVCSQFHLDDCRETVAVTENSVHDQSVIPEGITLPRLMLSLAHNGKVAWDVKWRPFDALDSKAKHHLGYLAILLGNGSLEVWEVPTHNLVKILYANCQIEDTDPRFLKLQPVFRCSRMNFGERQSIPLTLEWSPSASRDLILAGCHDGTVALWKFCSQLPSKDTKPLLCFTADTVPIRSLAWAPDDSDAECSNLIVTGGHEGLKFWDLRSPYRPLLDLCPVQKAVLSLDWLKDPRCLVIAYEDGIVRTLSLTKMADDMLATGEASARTKQQGLHSQLCSIFTIWSVQVSRSTGLVAYCSSDGCTRYFQLTSESVNKDRSRYRMPHLLCGSLTEEGPTLSINTPLKAICWHDNHGTNNNSSHKKRKGNPSKEAEAGEKGALHGIDKMGDESKQNIQRFPPKIVAMHKLRWNLNKGSERWLCYGGAAGIVRCQIISPI